MLSKNTHRILTWLLLFLAIVLVSAPYWLEWVLPRLVNPYGFVYKDYTDVSVRGFTLREVEFVEEDYRVTVKQMTLPSPLFWAMGRFVGHLAMPVELVDVVVTEKTEQEGSDDSVVLDFTRESAYGLFNEFLTTVKDINRWLPNMRIQDLKFTDQLDFSLITWGSDVIFVNGLYLPKNEYFRFRTQIFPDKNKIEGLFVLPRYRAFFEGDVAISEEQLDANGKITWMDNVSTLVAIWDQKSFIPYHMDIQSEAWTLPAEWLTIPGYHQPTFSGSLAWRKGVFHLDARGISKIINPKEGHDLNTIIKLSFSERTLKIDELKVETPWVHSGKEEDQIPNNNLTELNIDINLDKIVFINADGHVKGQVLVQEDRDTDYPEVKINLSGVDLVYDKHAVNAFDLVSHFNWPNFELESFKLDVDRVVNAELSLKANFQTHSHSGHLLLSMEEYEHLLPATHYLNWNGTARNIDSFLLDTATKTGEHHISSTAEITDTHFIAHINTWQIIVKDADEEASQAVVYNATKPFSVETAFGKRYYRATDFKFTQEDGLSEFEGNFFINEWNKGHFQTTLTDFPITIIGTIVDIDPMYAPFRFTTLVAYFDLEEKVVVGKLNTEFAHPINASRELYGNLSLDIQDDELKAESEVFLNADEQLVSLQVDMPVDKKFWLAVFTGKNPEWIGLKGNVEANKIPIKTLRAFLPDVVKQQGSLTINIAFSSGEDWKGTLLLEGMSTYPLMPMGPIDNIHSFLSFTKTEARITTFSGTLGTQPVELTGSINYEDFKKPKLDLELKGKEVPILRSPGLVLKADIDLTAKTVADKTTIAGNILLRDGFALLTFGDFKTSMGSPGSNPPYFSVKNPLVADWHLNVAIEGEQFLTLDTPVFKSKFSANLKLFGTLENPVCFGQITLNGGTIKFPFTTFNIQQGEVLLSESNPYSPELSITGTGKTYGYDLTINIGGTADDPQITFSSSPPLESGQILLMVTSGQIPQSTQQRSTSQRLGSLGLFLGSGVFKDLGGGSDLADRVKVTVGEQISDSGQDTINIEFKATDRLSVVAERDRFDAYNLDLVWRVYAK